MAQQGPPGRKDPLAPQGHKGPPGRKDPLAPQGHKGHKGRRAKMLLDTLGYIAMPTVARSRG